METKNNPQRTSFKSPQKSLSNTKTESSQAKSFRMILANLILGLTVLGIFAFTLADIWIPAAIEEQKPIYKGKSETNMSLMVNVYWGTEYLDDMLAIFEKHKVTTTFFVGGTWAAENDDMLKKIALKGHEIGNHGYFHKDHKKLNRNKNKEEISITHQLVKSITGVEMTLFAPPSGSFSTATVEVAKELGYTTVMWTYDTIDWRDHDKDLIYKRATKDLSGGNLILMHPTADTAAALDKIIKTIKQNGLTVTPVSKAL